MFFLLDAQLPPRLVRHLVAAGHRADHVFTALSARAGDQSIAAEANRLSCVLISKDDDFVEFSQRGILLVPLVWIRSGNMTTLRLWKTIQPALPRIEQAVVRGARIIEVA